MLSHRNWKNDPQISSASFNSSRGFSSLNVHVRPCGLFASKYFYIPKISIGLINFRSETWVDLLGDIRAKSSNECPRQTREATGTKHRSRWNEVAICMLSELKGINPQSDALWSDIVWCRIVRRRDHRDVPCWQGKLKGGKVEGWDQSKVSQLSSQVACGDSDATNHSKEVDSFTRKVDHSKRVDPKSLES